MKENKERINDYQRGAEREERHDSNYITSKPSGDNDWLAGGIHAVVKPEFAISGTFLSKFLHQSCLWDSQLKACRGNDWQFLLMNRIVDTEKC